MSNSVPRVGAVPEQNKPVPGAELFVDNKSARAEEMFSARLLCFAVPVLRLGRAGCSGMPL